MAKKILSDLDFGSVSRIQNLPDATLDQHPATFAQLKAAIEGLAWKDSARVASVANINLASPGATIDGVTMVSGDRVLVKDQTTASANGIYLWTGAGTAMTRALDANTANELEQAVVTVEEGTSAGASFRQTAVNFTVDSGNVAFASFGMSAAQATETLAGIARIATQTEVDGGTLDNVLVTPLKLKNYASAAKRFATTIGDGSATSYTINHNLNTKDVIVNTYLNASTFDEVFCDVQHTSVNSITLVFSSAPTTNQIRVVVLA